MSFLVLAAFPAALSFFGFASPSASLSSFFFSRAESFLCFSRISSGISQSSKSFFAAISNIRAMLCLQGNCLLGQEQRNTGAAPSSKKTETL